ncbi:MAG: substrate-binding domain-containing protein [Alphaproteobacteria bacterium]
MTSRRSGDRFRRILLPLVVLGFSLPAVGAAQTLKIGGTGGALGTMQILGRAFEKQHAGVSVEILPSLGSGGGIKAVLAGAIDIGLSARPLKAKERDAGARAHPYAKAALVFATQPGNPEVGVTTEQLIEMYAGARRRWPDGTPIRIVLRPDTDSDTIYLRGHIPSIGPALDAAADRPGVPVAFTAQDSAELLQRLPGSLGTTMLALILSENRPLKALSLDGVAPTPEAMADGSYRLTETCSIVTGPEPGEMATRFIAFVYADEGAAILRRTGHLPLAPEGGQ